MVSKLPGPHVSIRAGPVEAGIQAYQTERPPESDVCCGSPGSLVASTFVPVVMPESPASTAAAAKLSFAGGAAWADTTKAERPSTETTPRASVKMRTTNGLYADRLTSG